MRLDGREPQRLLGGKFLLPGTLLLILSLGAADCASRSGGSGSAEMVEGTSIASRVNELADAYVRDYFKHFPDDATAEGYPGADHGRLTDNSLEAMKIWQESEDEILGALREIDASQLIGSPAYVTYSFLRERLEGSVALRTCREDLWRVSPTYNSWQAGYPFLATIQPVLTPEKRQMALERFGAFGSYLDNEIANLREGMRSGHSAPRHNVRTVIQQMDDMLALGTEGSPFFNPAVRDPDPEFRSKLAKVVEEKINPAVQRYRDFLAEEYVPFAREEIAVAANPNGERCYRQAVRFHTTLDISPQEIHDIGLREMAKLQAEMLTIADKSFGTRDVTALLQELRTNTKYTFGSRQELERFAQNALDRAREAVPDWFGRVPRSEVVIQAFPEFQEKSAPGGVYNSPSEEEGRPGIYRINLYQPEKQSRAGIESTAFHETYPGHHLQNSIALERKDLHSVSRYFYSSGFGEGWALYTERLADEMGLYSADIDRFGMLSDAALRAARLVVDSGMHAFGWSRQRAIDYLLEHTTLSPSSAAAEIDRYLAVPGQATAYMLGNLEIRRLREKAQESLGPRFDIKEYHDRVLENGAVPLSMLSKTVDLWVRKQLSAGG
ncbi:MAG: DUF885 domain-containing protein [Acidobacteria bacterium]|nr:DUF885 domain-containing protein [Acidobacteriota bacterium]